jgi:tRNA pseudouridine38-40 synthase
MPKSGRPWDWKISIPKKIRADIPANISRTDGQEERFMRNIKLTIAYDGTDFQGWQIQKQGRTIQGEVEKALSRMHKRDISVVCAGRTDSGVHANGQVINFMSELDDIPVEKLSRAVSSFFPKDVSAVRAEVVADDFHARHAALRRSYKYYIFPSPVRIPHYQRYSLRTLRMPDIARLNRYASRMVGEHDFTTFSAPNDQVPHRVRRVLSAGFYPEGDFIVFRITGRAFLWKMVRGIVGSLLEYEERGLHPDQVAEYLAAADRKLAGMTAQARGLFFDRVEYEAKPGAF